MSLPEPKRLLVTTWTRCLAVKTTKPITAAFGAGLMVGDNLKLEAGSGIFQQGQILNVDDTLSEHYGALIMAYGGAAKWAGVVGRICRSLNRPISPVPKWSRIAQHIHPTYSARRLRRVDAGRDQCSSHNLLSATNDDTLVMETGIAGTFKRSLFGWNILSIDLVYKDLAYILFNVPGLTSGVAMNPYGNHRTTVRAHRSALFRQRTDDPQYWLGLMQPATYTTSDGTFVQYTERDKEQFLPTKPSRDFVQRRRSSVDILSSVVLTAKSYTQWTTTNQSSFKPRNLPKAIVLPGKSETYSASTLIMRARLAATNGTYLIDVHRRTERFVIADAPETCTSTYPSSVYILCSSHAETTSSRESVNGRKYPPPRRHMAIDGGHVPAAG